MKAVTQEAFMGCAISCVALILSVSYKEARKSFKSAKRKEYTTGFYNRDILFALRKNGIKAQVRNLRKRKIKKFSSGTIIFIECSNKYMVGHYLLKTKNGWMNPWLNFPNINPAKASFLKKLPGKARWAIILNSPDRKDNGFKHLNIY